MQTGFAIPEDELREQARADGITHLSTGVAIVRDGKVLVVRRAADDYLGGSYELPGGGIEEGESLYDAVVREVREETGLEIAEILGMFPGFEYSTPKKPRVRQMNFIVSVAGGEVRLSDEHDDYMWIGDEEEVDTLPVTESMKTCLKDALEVTCDLQA